LSKQASTTIRFAIGVALTLPAASCLPKDTRPPPSRVLFTASPSASLASTRTTTITEDGWGLSFTRVLATVGRASLDGDSCSSYSEARYTRVLSLIGAPARDKISESFGLGQCDFGFAVINAESDSLLGSTATADDVALLRTLGTDKYAGSSGVSFYVEGRAVRGELTKTFAWKFRGRVRFDECAELVDGASVRGLKLQEDGDVNVDVTLAPEALFGDNLDPTLAKLRFDAVAAADTDAGDDDGEVTLDELGLVPLASLSDGDAYTPTPEMAMMYMTLEDFVYLGVSPAVARYQATGKCSTRPRGQGGGR
jgi:hypothetical protein